MMANTTGSSFRDATLSLTLCESALSFALQHLSPSSSSESMARSSTRIQLVVKHFNSHHTKEFTERLRKYFHVVRWIKPDSSRKESKEGFLVCGGLKAKEQWPLVKSLAKGEKTEVPAEEDSLYF